MRILFTLVGSLLLSLTLSSQSYRYTNTVFPTAPAPETVVYGTAPFLNSLYYNESDTSPGNLVMDVYRPVGDPNTNRPAIIFAHSGGFITGDRNHDDMVAACDSFARRGYVTATIDYRQGFYPISNAALHGTRAVYRGIQDGRAAVRYLRANAATYGIDPNRVYLAGSSAGAFIALHSVYMDDPTEQPAETGAVSYSNLFFPFFHSGPDLGPVDVGDHLSFSGTPDGVVALWGAVQGTDLITASDDNRPVLLVHGTDDGTVPFESGPPFGLGTFPDVDGSALINDRLNSLGQNNKDTYFVDGAGHEFHGTSNGDWENGSNGNAYWDTIVQKTGNFLWLQHKPLADFSAAETGLSVAFTDNSSGAIAWLWDFGDGSSSIQQNPVHVYPNAQPYRAALYVENANLSWDTISLLVSPQAPLPVVWAGPLTAEAETTDVRLRWSVARQSGNAAFEVEHRTANGRFETIGTLAGALESAATESYHFLHRAPGSGTHLYRIRQVDADGSFTYGNLASVELEEHAGLRVYPNPARQSATIEWTGFRPGTFDVYNALGQRKASFAVAGKRTPFSLTGLQSGTYLVRLRNGGLWIRLIVR